MLVGGGFVGQEVPLAVGMWSRHRRPVTAQRAHRLARRVADVVLAALVVYFAVTAGRRLPELGCAPLAVAALLVASAWRPWRCRYGVITRRGGRWR
ncbi:hypothetical protein OHA72_27450 [Dactylosporangium sp. NBC_01737]|uniref:hypothetical protein n=1 Tax=Dactylosporangium sp. NBC_01737 TaxID=2975959 RepID=UPI002E125124|nr:hypothetical protein OHA72_27450 [Dactylosporangium sp. NBC_01737]